MKLISDVQYQTNVVRFFDKLQLTEPRLTVNKAKESFDLLFHEFHRFANFEAQYFSIIGADRRFISIYNGYIGFAPYSDTDSVKQRSFLYQLKQQGMIDHCIVSFYVKPESGNTSQIKFGSWDKSAFDGELLMFRTTSQYSWALNANQFKLGAVDLLLGDRFVQMDPMYPYLYIPDADFQVFAKQVQSNYAKLFQNKICDAGKCKWDKPCDQITGKKEMNLGIKIKS